MTWPSGFVPSIISKPNPEYRIKAGTYLADIPATRDQGDRLSEGWLDDTLVHVVIAISVLVYRD
jgi:hypothetical protein